MVNEVMVEWGMVHVWCIPKMNKIGQQVYTFLNDHMKFSILDGGIRVEPFYTRHFIPHIPNSFKHLKYISHNIGTVPHIIANDHYT